MTTEFINNGSEQWNVCVEKNNHEFYQKPQFAKLEEELIKGSALAWYGKEAGDWILIPLVKRRIPDEITNEKEYYDLVSPYGYPGILFNQECSYEVIIHLLNKFKQEAFEQGFISSFLRLNPISNPFLFNESDDSAQIVHGKVVLLDMSRDYPQQRKKYSSNHRRNIKKLNKEGFTVEWNKWDEIGSFIDVYNETMEREEASEYYFFPESYYHDLKNMLDESSIDLLIVKTSEGEPVAGGIFCNNGHTLQYHLGGTKGKYLKEAPSKLLFDSIIKKYSEKARYFNLGGGVGGTDDSLFRFKEGFGKEYRKFSTLRIVHDRQRYNNLCQDYTKSELYSLNGFFPLYRKDHE